MTTILTLPNPALAPSIRKLALPFSLNPAGSFATVVQDSLDDVAQCVGVLLRTPLGSRLISPDYGVVDPTFADADPAAISAAVAEWEPRATVTIDTSPSPDGATQNIRVQVSIVEDAS